MFNIIFGAFLDATLSVVNFFFFLMIIGANIAVSEIMYHTDRGRSRIIAPILGFLIGYFFFSLAPTNLAVNIFSVLISPAATVGIDLLLTNKIYPMFEDKLEHKFGDKVHGYFDRKEQEQDSKDFQMILHGSTAEERVIYIKRHIYMKQYCFTFTIEPAVAFDKILEAINNSSLKESFSELIIDTSVGTRKDCDKPWRSIEFMFPRVHISIVNDFSQRSTECLILGMLKKNKDGLNSREKYNLDEKAAHLLDSIYMIISKTMKNLDNSFRAEIITFGKNEN